MLDAMMIDGELMPQGEDFKLHGVTRLETGGKVSEGGRDDRWHG